MTEALRLGDPAADASALRSVLILWPDAWRTPWRRIEADDGCWITAPGLADHAKALAGQGVTLEEAPEGELREADSLPEAVPLRLAPEVAPEEALLLVKAEAAHATITRLLRLNHQAIEVAQWTRGGEAWLALRVPAPPLYLLMRARDQADAVRAYARLGQSAVFTAWGWIHPLAERLPSRIEGAVLIEPEGWHHADWPLDWTPLDAHLDAHLDAPRRDLQASDDPPPRFTVQLRLEEGQPRLGTLWLLDPQAFAGLAPIIESSSPAALRAVRVSRLEDAGQVRYLLRAQGSDDAVTGRIGDLIERPGFAHLPGAERIFVPAGMRLMPQMGLDALRAVLEPPADGVVLVEATRDGPSVLRVRAPEAIPLAQWVEYVTLDNRAVLDAMLEEAVFAMPALAFDRPLSRVERRAPPRKRPQKPAKARLQLPADAAAPVDGVLDDDYQAAQAEAAEIQTRIVEGGLADAAIFGRMGALLMRLGAPSDAAWCFETAAFHAADRATRIQWLTPLLAVRRQQGAASPEALDDAVLEAATTGSPTPAQVGLLGAACCAGLMHGTPLLDGVRAPLISTFSSPLSPGTRRLAWMTLFEAAAATGDALGATRAKEAIFGALNSTGLRDAFDAPAFVRLSLALTSDEDGGRSDAQAIQGASLEAAWIQFEAGHADCDAQALLYKSIFALGFARLGMGLRARQLATLVEDELPVHDAPTGALARLYLARLASQGSGDEDAEAGWEIAAEGVLGVLSAQHQRAARFARRKSAWLKGRVVEKPFILRPHVVKIAAREPDDPAKGLSLIAQMSDAWDVEIAASVRTRIDQALASGKDEVIEATIAVANRAVETIQIPAHTVCALGDVLRAQALMEDVGVERSIRRLAGSIHKVDSLVAILPTVRVALSALRRVDAGPRVEDLLDNVTQVIERGPRQAAQLGAFVADGYRLMGDPGRARRALDAALDAIFDPDLDNISRFESVATLFDILRGWPSEMRESVAHRVLHSVDRFRDGFTTRRFFELFKVLCVERVVDALVDTHSLGSGRIRGWLEREEQAIRRQILADWRRVR